MKISAWDRFMLRVAPRWSLNRMQARRVASVLAARNYEAATLGRRTKGYARSHADVNAVVARALAELRIHARDLVRNNAWAKRAQRVIANNVVGWGIVPKPVGKDAARALELWKAWSESTQCESEGRHTFASLQHLVMRSLTTDGEVLIRRRRRLEKDKLPIPLQLQVLEADFLDTSKDESTSLSGGAIVNGVEYDALGRRAAYWLFDVHPGSGLLTKGTSKRVSASEIIHVFYTERPNQARGVSWYGASIVNLKELDEYEDAELMRQKIAACFAAFVTDIDGQQTPAGLEDDDGDEDLEAFEPGMISHLSPGKDVKFASPPATTSDSFTHRNLRRIAAGLGVTYEDLTGDYSQVNFSSARMSRIAHWGNVRDWQFNMLIPLLCNGVWAWAMEAAVISGLLREAPAAEWTTPPMPMIEPDKEGLAYQRLVRNGVMTFSDVVREQGGDPDAHFAEYAADLKRLDEAGIKLDSDVRAVSQAGLTQERGGGGQGAPQGPDEAERAIISLVEGLK
jgi:lambda family phage portal protein